jgi:hypothetical protein
MKSILKENVHTDDDLTFPQMYRSRADGFVVLFTNKTTGMVIKDSGPNCLTTHSIGYHLSFWRPCNIAQEWERLPEGSSITLIQENTN